MKSLLGVLRPAFMSLLIMTIICGIIYPGIVTGFAQTVFPNKANGSIITVKMKDGTKQNYGSELIAQEFSKPEYLIGRPMGITNLNPTGDAEKKLVQTRVDWIHSIDKENKAEIPMDLVTASGSGVDPNISPAAAEYQVKRIARIRGVSEASVRNVINQYTKGRFLGFFGEAAVNVLQVNLALDGLI